MVSNNIINNCIKNETVTKIINKTVNFHNLLESIDFMISGSFLISIFLNREDYSDIDIYFKNKKDYKKAIDLVKSSSLFELTYSSKYAQTYQCKKTNLLYQLVKNPKKNVYTLAMSHDFANCSIAYSSKTKSIYISKQAQYAWANNYLILNKTPCLSKNYPIHNFYNQFYLLSTRVKKYIERYSLKLDFNTKNDLKKVIQKFNKNEKTLLKNKNIIPIQSYDKTIYILSLDYKKSYYDLNKRLIYETNMFKLPQL